MKNEALKQAIDRHGSMVYRIAMSILGNAEDAEDAGDAGDAPEALPLDSAKGNF